MVTLSSKLAKSIHDHFTDTNYRFNPENASSQQTLIAGRIVFKRWMLLPVTSIIQLCVGSFYAWSVLSAGLSYRIGSFSTHSLSIAFYICVAFFGIASCISGPWLERVGPKKPAILGAILFLLGNLVTSLGVYLELLWIIYIGYGLIAGVGIGTSYLVPVAVLQKYYSEMRGIAAGVAVGSFGLGSLIASYTNSAIVDSGIVPGLWFVILGGAYFAVQFPLSFLLRFPIPDSNLGACVKDNSVGAGADHGKSGKTQTVSSNRNTPNLMKRVFSVDFLFIYVIFITSVMPGLVFVSRVANIAVEAFGRKDAKAWISGVTGIFNVTGRLFVGIISDKLGRLPPLLFTIVLQIGMLISLHFALIPGGQFEAFYGSLWILTFCYGASLGLVPGLLGDCFGGSQVGALYGISLTGWSLGGVIGGVGIAAKIDPNTQGHFDSAIYGLLATTIVSAIVTMIFTVRLSKRRQGDTNNGP